MIYFSHVLFSLVFKQSILGLIFPWGFLKHRKLLLTHNLVFKMDSYSNKTLTHIALALGKGSRQ